MQDKYIMYLRKSRADRDAGETIEATLKRHRDRLMELCSSMSIQCSTILQEVGSADSIAARPEMMRLLSMVETGSYDGVVCIDMDRLSRGSGADQALVINTFKYSGTKIITPYKTYDFNQDIDEQMAEFGLMIGRSEYRQIKKRLWAGRIAACKEGRYVGGNPPYGYRTERLKKGFKLAIDPDQAKVVKRIFDLYTEESKGAQKIASILNTEGVLNAQGRLWRCSIINKILANPTYIGKIRFQRRKEVHTVVDGAVKSKSTTTNGLLFDGMHDPIISAEQFYRAEKMRKNADVPRLRRTFNTANPFLKLAVCSECGKHLRCGAQKSGKSYVKRLYCPTPGCATVGCMLSIFEDRVLSALDNWLAAYEFDNAESSTLTDTADFIRQRVNSIDKELESLKKRSERCYDAYENGDYDLTTFRKRKNDIDAKANKLSEDKGELVSELSIIEAQMASAEYMAEKAVGFRDKYDQCRDAESKNALLKEILDKVVYKRTVRSWHDPDGFEIYIYPKIAR